MNQEIKYIELKTGFSDDGPAWIARISYSKSGKSIYFSNKLLKSSKGAGISANYFDMETGDEYWISGVKKQEWNCHQSGKGGIMIEKSLVNWFNNHVNYLERSFLRPIDDFPPTDKKRLQELENN